MAALKLGVMARVDDQPLDRLRQVSEFGLDTCQACSWEPATWSQETGRALLAGRDRYGVDVTAIWAGYSGPRAWNFTEGPITVGLVPPEYRNQRVQELIAAAEFARQYHFPAVVTHVGFIPETPTDPLYEGTLEAIRRVTERCAELGVEFWFESGQETPVTLLRTIERIDTGNLGVNLDTANLILYGKGNPVDALDVLGKYVRGVHIKDGCYPTDGDHLGRETPVGQGKVDFPAFLGKLKSLGYEGALTIEREISGPRQIEDISRAIELLRPLC